MGHCTDRALRPTANGRQCWVPWQPMPNGREWNSGSLTCRCGSHVFRQLTMDTKQTDAEPDNTVEGSCCKCVNPCHVYPLSLCGVLGKPIEIRWNNVSQPDLTRRPVAVPACQPPLKTFQRMSLCAAILTLIMTLTTTLLSPIVIGWLG